MLSAALLLLCNSLFLSLHLSGSAGSFPKPLPPEKERECLERCAAGDLRSKNNALAGSLVRVSWSLVLLGCYWLFCRIAEEISADFVTCTVHVSLCQESQYGVHCTIVIGNLRILGVDCLRNKLGNAYFVDVGMCLENLIDFRHVAAATCKDDTTQQLI